MNLGKTHIVWGVLGLIAFALTGQYMEHVIGPMDTREDGPRILIRSAHIYIFFASLINVVYGTMHRPLKLKRISWLVSATIFAAPIFMLLTFFDPEPHVDKPRLYVTAGLYSLLGAGGLLVLERLLSRG